MFGKKREERRPAEVADLARRLELAAMKVEALAHALRVEAGLNEEDEDHGC